MSKEVIEEIAKYLGVTPQDIDLHASLAEDLELGPIELSDLLGSLTQTFHLSLSAHDVEGLKTVNDIVELVEDQSLE